VIISSLGASTFGLLVLEHIFELLFHGVDPCSFRIDVGLRLLKPIEILLLENEPIWCLFYQIIISVKDLASLVHLTDDFESTSQISLFYLVHAILVILVRELENHCLPFLEQLRGS
jgi:hypothetical protein